MKYSLVNGERQEAQTGLIGKCECCGSLTIARCGTVKIWHWAHKGKCECDPWWENETEWHRAWKGQFPKEWQEIIHYAEDGEKHIADVKTDQNCVIEFQHSYLKPDERQARDTFYLNMVWIVDGTRRLRDKDKLMAIWEKSGGIYGIWTEPKPISGNIAVRRLQPFDDECALLRDWGDSKSPVFFDFGENVLWGLLPRTIEKFMYLIRIDRDILISSLYPTQQQQLDGFETLLKIWTNLTAADERKWQMQGILQAQQAHFLPHNLISRKNCN